MTIFDAPAPLFAALDPLLRALVSTSGALVIWGLLAALVSMGLYRILSRQRAIEETKSAARAAKLKLRSYDGDFEGLTRLLGQAIGTSLRQLRLTLIPAILASLPLISLLVWLDSTYGHHIAAPGTPVELRAQPDDAKLHATAGGTKATTPGNVLHVIWPAEGERLTVLGPAGRVLLDLPPPYAVTTIHKRAWWNNLIGNPIGYLPSEGPVDLITLDLPPAHYLSFGPSWLRGWEAVFLSVLLIGSLFVKVVLRIH
jgi:hypothetical protein